MEAGARARPAYRRRRVRRRRHDRAPARGRCRRALHRLLHRDKSCRPASLRTRSRARCGRRRPSSGSPSRTCRCTTSRCGTFPERRQGHPRAPALTLGGVAPRCGAPAERPRHPPGPPGDRERRAPRLQAHDDPRLRDPVEQLHLQLPGIRGARTRARRAQGGRTLAARSQQHRNYADAEYIWNLARTNGINIGRAYAEVFSVYRIVA